ncbi:hypothetical protein RLEG3_13050 [Rhizobium leguminosarum bv. trifolii WSM1689]|uniref:hypothetical protein n=1 Tax=Rhizobium leguminosarum TaxID=384 RepID=UPI0003E0B5DB|nr:hypothetical protein [Rhizobium leguminosarum]AHF86653.1 hypothetical protein RLEG3_13050 [Rhizobium leguminosarum bv. trifolii WSM1689]
MLTKKNRRIFIRRPNIFFFEFSACPVHQNKNAPSLLIEGAFGPPVVEPQSIETLIRQGQGTCCLRNSRQNRFALFLDVA